MMFGLRNEPLSAQSTYTAAARQLVGDKLLAHRRYIEEHGEDLPEIRQWHWLGKTA
ncbi:hypothetical protein [Pseudomonas sp.]|uniref:hypothetical protein n=1 Tax=Pseudomonas sp. TaxID=306 RepID=UPI003563C8BD